MHRLCKKRSELIDQALRSCGIKNPLSRKLDERSARQQRARPKSLCRSQFVERPAPPSGQTCDMLTEMDWETP